MRQRNVSGSPLHIPDIPALVLHGEDIEWDEPLAGFEPLTDPPPAAATGKTVAPAGKSASDGAEAGK